MKPMTIAGLAREGGVGVETIRYYQRRGLLDTPERPGGGTRRYGEADMRRLRFIRSAQAAGFTLDEIAALAPEAIVLSPGPATPNEAGICLALMRFEIGANKAESETGAGRFR